MRVAAIERGLIELGQGRASGSTGHGDPVFERQGAHLHRAEEIG
jgi:hypothetical protein